VRVHWLIHDPAERPGIMESWFKAQDFSISETLLGRDLLPNPDSLDLLLVMGGPMGVYDEDRYPWLVDEKGFIRRVIDSGKGVLGICLGSQLIAAALDQRVYPHTRKEIGWFPVSATPEKKQAPLFDGLPDTLTVMHWHGDTFDTGPGLVPVYSSQATPHQAFQYGSRVAALQFHPEMTERLVHEFCEAFEVVPGPSVQTREEILAGQNHIDAGNRFLFALLENWVKASSEQRSPAGR
jgi:GMP synthase (glutamine-hydrolysing)